MFIEFCFVDDNVLPFKGMLAIGTKSFRGAFFKSRFGCIGRNNARQDD